MLRTTFRSQSGEEATDSYLARYFTGERLCLESREPGCPQGPQALGSQEGPRLWTCGQPGYLQRDSARRPPRSLSFEHDVKDGEQLAHGGGEGNLGWFATLAQAAIEDAHGWIAADCRKRGHVEHAPHRGPAAEDRFVTLPASALLAERRHPDQGGYLAAVKLAQFGQTCEQHVGQPRAHARHTDELLLERLQAGRGINPLGDLMVDGVELALERANRAPDT